MPDHGAFGELIRSTGGGVLVPPGSIEALSRAIVELQGNPNRRHELAEAGLRGVHQRHSIGAAAKELTKLIGR